MALGAGGHRLRRGHETGSVDEWMRNYYATSANLDWNIGRILDAVDKAGLADDALIVFTSDHGEMFGGHGRMKKEHLLRGGHPRPVPDALEGPNPRGQHLRRLPEHAGHHADPLQRTNRIDDPAHFKRVHEYRTALKDRMAELNDTFPPSTWYRDHWTDGNRRIIASAQGPFPAG